MIFLFTPHGASLLRRGVTPSAGLFRSASKLASLQRAVSSGGPAGLIFFIYSFGASFLSSCGGHYSSRTFGPPEGGYSFGETGGSAPWTPGSSEQAPRGRIFFPFFLSLSSEKALHSFASLRAKDCLLLGSLVPQSQGLRTLLLRHSLQRSSSTQSEAHS